MKVHFRFPYSRRKRTDVIADIDLSVWYNHGTHEELLKIANALRDGLSRAGYEGVRVTETRLKEYEL